jgi:hypothetical protein
MQVITVSYIKIENTKIRPLKMLEKRLLFKLMISDYFNFLSIFLHISHALIYC